MGFSQQPSWGRLLLWRLVESTPTFTDFPRVTFEKIDLHIYILWRFSSFFFPGHFGKYLNEYDGTWVPLGWKKWEGLLHNSKFYNYTLRHNNYKERHKMSYETDYFTDLITNRSISFIKQTVAANPNSPFLAVLSHSAPHGPETPAPQYSTAFPNAKAPRY